MTSPKLVAEVKNGQIKQGENIILDQIDFSVAEAEFCYIIGKTGSGKSSLLKMLYGAIPLTSGSAFVNGEDLTQMTKSKLPLFRRNLGMVFQDYMLIEDWSVFQNLDYILKATDWKVEGARKIRVREVLKGVGMENRQGDKISKLSGGEMQRIAIARAMLNKPKLIIADEPTGDLDPDTSDQILFLLRNLAASNNSAILIATHDYRLLEKLPARVYKCENQKLIEQ
jgi:cell division transport system ATP-binding protein